MEAETSPSAGIGANLISGSSRHSHFQNFSFFSSFFFFLFCGFSLSTASTSRHLLLSQQKSEARPAARLKLGKTNGQKNSRQFYTASDPPGLHPVKVFALRLIYTTLRPFKVLVTPPPKKVLKVNFQPQRHHFPASSFFCDGKQRNASSSDVTAAAAAAQTPAHTCLDTRHKPRPRH